MGNTPFLQRQRESLHIPHPQQSWSQTLGDTEKLIHNFHSSRKGTFSYSLYLSIFVLINLTQWCVEIRHHSFSFDGLTPPYPNNSLLRRNFPDAYEKPLCLGMTIASGCPHPSPHPVLPLAHCCGPSSAPFPQF